MCRQYMHCVVLPYRVMGQKGREAIFPIKKDELVVRLDADRDRIYPSNEIHHGPYPTWELPKNPLDRGETSMSRHVINCSNAFRKCHVKLFTPNDIGLLNHLREHSLEGLIASLNSTNLPRTFQWYWIESYTLLG